MMQNYERKKNLIPFRPTTLLVILASLIFISLGLARFFKVDFVLNFLPEITREMLDDSPIWVYYVYLVTVLTNLAAIVLLYRRSMYSVTVSQYSAAGMTLLITYHFFSTDNIYLYEAIEMLFTLLFYLLLAWFATYARRNGELERISKEKTTISLKIQEGCDHECAYCPIPTRKGRSRSDTLKNILANAESMAQQGIKDIVLIGDNVGDYGTGENGNLKHLHSFYDLITELDKIGDIHRFTFLSVTTPMFSNKTLKFIKKSKRFSPYFSIRMDSGSEEMLQKMNRPFPLNLYKELYLNIKKIIPEAYIVVEILVGFPGETEELFNETVQFLSESSISYINTTIYSDKIGTKAFGTIKGAVPKSVRKKRAKVLKELSKKKLNDFYESQLGLERVVLFENRSKGGFIFGYTDNHVKVKTLWDHKLGNTLHKIKLTGINGSFMTFDFIKDESFITHDSYVHI